MFRSDLSSCLLTRAAGVKSRSNVVQSCCMLGPGAHRVRRSRLPHALRASNASKSNRCVEIKRWQVVRVGGASLDGWRFSPHRQAGRDMQCGLACQDSASVKLLMVCHPSLG